MTATHASALQTHALSAAALKDAEQRTSRFLKAQLSSNRQEAVRIAVEPVERGASIHDVHHLVIRPAQYEIGRLWHENEISVAQEHMATAIAQLALSHLYRFLRRAPSNGKRVLVACVEGETHELGARIIADLLEGEGFDVWYLGANVPTESLLNMVQTAPPDVLAFSVAMTFNVPALAQAVDAIHKAVRSPIKLVGGGPALWGAEQVWSQVGLHVLSDDPKLIVHEFRNLLNSETTSAVT